MTYDDAFDRLIGNEGGYVNNSADPGGETMWGITARVARANGYTGDMRSLPRDTAKAIAKACYWTPMHCDELPVLLRFDAFDGAYNSSPAQAAKWLQRAIGVTADGNIGPATLAAAAAADPLAVARYNGLRLQFMCDLYTFGQFGKGWSRRIASNLIALEA